MIMKHLKKKFFFTWKWWDYLCIFPTRLPCAECGTMLIFQWNTTSLNSDFFFFIHLDRLPYQAIYSYLGWGCTFPKDISVKCKQPHLGFELGLLSPLVTITIKLNVPLYYLCIDHYFFIGSECSTCVLSVLSKGFCLWYFHLGSECSTCALSEICYTVSLMNKYTPTSFF